MNDQNSAENMLDSIARVLLICFFIGIVFLSIWVVIVMAVPDWAWQLHGKFFDLSGEQVVLIQYAGLLMTKVAIFGLFLFPCLGIKLSLRKKNTRPSSI